MTVRNHRHEANIAEKARRGLDAITQASDLIAAQEIFPEVIDRLSGYRFFSRALIGENNPEAWALIAGLSGDEDFRESRELLMSGIRDRIDLLAGPVADPFEGLDQ